jgi:hypothetical protein
MFQLADHFSRCDFYAGKPAVVLIVGPRFFYHSAFIVLLVILASQRLEFVLGE